MAVREISAITIESWLKDLRMECYRRNLETYPSFKDLLFVKDIELKKLGIQNARDRLTMINSLSSFAPRPYDGFGSKSMREQSEGKLKKGTPIKKLKGLLAGGNVLQKKSKKTCEVRITSPKLSFPDSNSKEQTTEGFSQSLSSNRLSMSLEDMILGMENQQRCTVENDYVPDPQGSPQFSHVPLQRSYTVSETRYREFSPPTTSARPSTVNYDEYPVPRQTRNLAVIPDKEFDHLSPKEQARDGNFTFEENSNGSSKHLSVVSMESGLGLTCESDDNFNASLPLEEQPWFHGKVSRSGAEALLEEDGDFLVHENPTTEGAHTLSLLWEGRCYHILINCDEVVMKGPHGKGVTIGYKYQFENGAFDSIPELIFNHLRYQIPISRDFDAIVRHPIYKSGSKDHSQSNYASEPAKNKTLPKNFSFSTRRSRVMSPDPPFTKERSNTLVRNMRSASFSPADSPRGSPVREIGKSSSKLTTSTSTNNLCIVSDIDEDEASDVVLKSIYKDVPDSPVLEKTPVSSTPVKSEPIPPSTTDPYNTYDIPVPSVNAMRPRARTENSRQNYPQTNFLSSSTLSDSSDYQHPRPYDPDDYEEMRSVSVFDTLPSSPNMSPTVSPKPKHKQIVKVPSVDDEQYAFLTPRNTLTPPGPQPGVKYAEITFKNRSHTVGSDYLSNMPNIVHGRQPKVTYVTTKTIREEVDNIGGHYAQPIIKPAALDRSISTSLTYRKPKRELPRQSSMDLLRPSRPTSTLSRNIKCPQTIQEIPAFLKEFTNEELAMHLTKADGVCFLLTPRPAEDPELWKNRVQELSGDGIFVGLEILASSTGVKLWKKLFHRHLSLSQLVVLCIIQVPDPVERAKTLKKWIELSQLLQSGTYANLFAFMSIMKGLESPQVSDLTRTWELLKAHYGNVYDIYENQLKGMISALMQGASVYSIEDLTIPAIQHLRKLYNDEATNPTTDIHTVLEDFTTRVTGLDGLQKIIRHTTDLSANAKKRLSSYSFDTLLFDFFMQDVARMHLQNIGTSSEEPLERYRRFNIVLDSLFHKIENP